MYQANLVARHKSPDVVGPYEAAQPFHTPQVAWPCRNSIGTMPFSVSKVSLRNRRRNRPGPAAARATMVGLPGSDQSRIAPPLSLSVDLCIAVRAELSDRLRVIRRSY